MRREMGNGVGSRHDLEDRSHEDADTSLDRLIREFQYLGKDLLRYEVGEGEVFQLLGSEQRLLFEDV